MRFEFFKGDHVKDDQSEAKDIGFEGICAGDFVVLGPDELRREEGHSAENGGFLQRLLGDYLTAPHITQLNSEGAAIHDEYVLWLDITMRDLNLLEGGKRTEYLLKDKYHLIGLQSIPEVPALREKLLQVDLRTFHHNEGVLLLIVLIAFHLGDQIPMVLHEPLALFR